MFTITMVGFGGMMRGIQNKVVHAAQEAVEVGKQAVGHVGAEVARDMLGVEGRDFKDAILNRALEKSQALQRYSGPTPSVSHKRPRRKRRAPTATAIKKKKPRRRKKQPNTFDVFD